MKILSNFFLPILLDRKREGNRGAFGKKPFSEPAFLILPLYNSFKDALLFLSLHRLIVSSSFCLPTGKSCIGIFGKDNAGNGRGDDIGSISANADGRTGVDNPSIGIDADIKVDNLGTVTDDLNIAADVSDIATDNPGIILNNLGTTVDDPGIATDNPSIETDADARTDDPGIARSNKAYAVSLFALCHTLFLLASSSKLVTVSLLSFLLSSSSTTLQSKSILSYSVTSIKGGVPSSMYPIDKMWTPSFNKVSSGMSAVVKLL